MEKEVPGVYCHADIYIAYYRVDVKGFLECVGSVAPALVPAASRLIGTH
jgi:hypothetical protein